jgi:hypothetical protein
MDSVQNRLVMQTPHGPRWGAEFPHVCTLDGIIRGVFEELDPGSGDPAQQIAGAFGKPEGKFTHLFIELEDGHMVMVKKTNPEEKSAGRQTFELSSTRKNLQNRGYFTLPVITDALKGAVLLPGEPIQLSNGMKTRAAIRRISAVDLSPGGEIDPQHPDLGKPERQRSTVME